MNFEKDAGITLLFFNSNNNNDAKMFIKGDKFR